MNLEKQLAKAIAIASEAFMFKTDKGGKPYILHCLWVMNKVRHLGFKYMIVAILHDLIEDTDWTLAGLDLYGFDLDIVHSVDCITKVKGESYDDYLSRVASNKYATAVKMRDLEHNSKLKRLKGITDKDIERTIKYQEAYRYLETKRF